MTSINDLKNISTAPTTVSDWLAKFTPEDQDTIITAIHTHSVSKVWEIISQLDENPFPFGRTTLVSWKHRNPPRAD